MEIKSKETDGEGTKFMANGELREVLRPVDGLPNPEEYWTLPVNGQVGHNEWAKTSYTADYIRQNLVN